MTAVNIFNHAADIALATAPDADAETPDTRMIADTLTKLLWSVRSPTRPTKSVSLCPGAETETRMKIPVPPTDRPRAVGGRPDADLAVACMVAADAAKNAQ